jgi:hypothetical protein
MRATPKGVDPRARTGICPLETPAPSERERLGAAQHEVDRLLRIAGGVVMEPEFCRAKLRWTDRRKPSEGGSSRAASSMKAW